MTLRHFQIFKAVCDNDGVTAASEQLNITQPSVSIAIRELEDFYNTKLFDRINRKMYLTEAGKTLRQYVENILNQFNEATDVLRDGRVFVKCRIGVNATFAECHLAHLLAALKKELPECDLQIVCQNSEQLKGMLLNNQIDFAVFDDLSEHANLQAEMLFREKEVLLAAESLYGKSSVKTKELAGLPLLLREEGSGIRNGVDKMFQSHSIAKQVFMESTSTMSLLEAAKKGFGVLFVPESFARMHADQLQVVELSDEVLYRNYYLMFNKKKYMTSMTQDIKTFLLQLCRNV